MYFKQRSIVFCLNYRALYAAALILLAYGRYLRMPPVVYADDIPLEYWIRTWYVPGVTFAGAVILTVAAGAHAWQRRDLRARRGLYGHGHSRGQLESSPV